MSDAPVVLVADDDADILALVRYRLSHEGYVVVEARDGEELCAWPRSACPRSRSWT